MIFANLLRKNTMGSQFKGIGAGEVAVLRLPVGKVIRIQNPRQPAFKVKRS